MQTLTDLDLRSDGSRIAGVQQSVLAPHRDDRGELAEVLRSDWAGPSWGLPCRQVSVSHTLPGVARDEDLWHVHRRQHDRVVVIQGAILLALFDARPRSGTVRTLELQRLGPAWGETLRTLLIPPGVYHGFLCVGQRASIFINMPNRLYDGADEGRVPFAEAGARFPNGIPFSWRVVRERAGSQI